MTSPPPETPPAPATQIRREVCFRIFIMIAPMSFALICAIAATMTQEGVFPWIRVVLVTTVVVLAEFLVMRWFYRKSL